MAANKRKILEAARKHAQKGAKEKALKEFGKLLKLDPRDSKVRLEMGDTYRRWGQMDEAVEAYSNVADQFMQEGFDARAVAVFKQIQNLQPNSFAHHEPLAELYQRMGLTAEAIGCLESAAESYREAGQKQEALGLLRKMAAIDPSNTTSRIKVADLLHQAGMKEDAVSEYDAVVAELELQGDTEAAAKLFERILEIEPERVETLVLYARNLIDRGSAQRAESLAKRALELDKSPEQYELLADVYRIEKREDDLIALYRELADLYRERGDEERTREILQRHVPLDELSAGETPNRYINEDENLEEDENLDEGEYLDEGENLEEDETLLDELSIGDETTLLDGDLLSDSSLLVSDDDSELGTLSQNDDLGDFSSDATELISDSNEMTSLLPDKPSGGTSTGGSDAGGAEVDVSQLLAEASVYLRYGKRSQAIANLESILEQDSEHRLALEKLGEALADGDDSAKAVEMWSRAAKLAAESGEADASEMLRSRIAALDPVAAEALDLKVADVRGSEPEPELTDALESDPDSDPDSGERLIEDDLLDDAIDDLPETDDLSASDSDNGPTSVDHSDLPELDLADVSISGMDIEIDIDDASFAREPSDEEPPIDQEPLIDEELPTGTEAELAADSAAPITDVELDEISIDNLSDANEAVESGDVDDEGVDSDALTVNGAGGGDVSPEKIAEDLEEADFYMEQGLLEEAEAVYSRILSVAPNHPLAMVRLGELASQSGDASDALDSGSDSASPAEDPAEGASEEPEANDIGADLADWQEDSPGDEAEETSEQPGGADSGARVRDGSSDFTAADVEWVDSTEALAGEERDRVGDESVAAESNLAADLGLGDSTGSDLVPEVDDASPTSADASDEMGEQPVGSEKLDVSAEPDGSEEPDPLEIPIDVSSEATAGEDEAAEGGDSFGFDLAAELSQSFDQDSGDSSSGATGAAGRGDTSEDGFASLFAEFKKGVSETLTEGDHQAHYDLGIAYREMGLLNDAITEFRLAMDATERRVGCLHLMGMCAHDTGEFEQAIGHFTEALAADGISDDAVVALKLDLGKAHETTGDIASARRAYEEIQAIDPDFSDVAARLAVLEKSEGAKSQEDSGQETEEYENFQEFLGEFDGPDAAESGAASKSPGDTEEAPVWENFDDVVAELDAEDDAESSSEEPEAAASAESGSNAEGPEPAGEKETTPKRRKKKISFI